MTGLSRGKPIRGCNWPKARRPRINQERADRANFFWIATKTRSSIAICLLPAMNIRTRETLRAWGRPSPSFLIFWAHAFLGTGAIAKIFGGSLLSDVTKFRSSIASNQSEVNADQAGIAAGRQATSAAPTSGCSSTTSLRTSSCRSGGRSSLADRRADCLLTTIRPSSRRCSTRRRSQASCRPSSPMPDWDSLDARRDLRPLLRVLPVRLRHRPQGRADHETGADAARGGCDRSSSSSTTGTAATKGCCPARRSTSTSSGWRLAYHDSNKRELRADPARLADAS